MIQNIVLVRKRLNLQWMVIGIVAALSMVVWEVQAQTDTPAAEELPTDSAPPVFDMNDEAPDATDDTGVGTDITESAVETWFVVDNEKVSGPFEKEQLLEMYRSKEFSVQARASQPGDAQWSPLRELLVAWFGPSEVPPESPETVAALKTERIPDVPLLDSSTTFVEPDSEMQLDAERFRRAENWARAGAVVWGIGQGFLVASPLIAVGSLASDETEASLSIAGGVFVAGWAGIHVGPIMASIAEGVARRAVGQRNRFALGATRFGPSGAFWYGMSWAMVGMAAASSWFAEENESVSNGGLVVFMVAMMVFRGMSAIGPLKRIRRYKRARQLTLRALPVLTSQYAGLSIGATF